MISRSINSLEQSRANRNTIFAGAKDKRVAETRDVGLSGALLRLLLGNVASLRASVAVVMLMHGAAESQLARPPQAANSRQWKDVRHLSEIPPRSERDGRAY